MGSKPFCIRFNEIDRYIKIYDGIRYIIWFRIIWFWTIWWNLSRYIISEKSGIIVTINHNFAEIRVDSCNSLPIVKKFTFHDVIILIKSVVDKNENNYYCNIFLGKGFYENKYLNGCLYLINARFL